MIIVYFSSLVCLSLYFSLRNKNFFEYHFSFKKCVYLSQVLNKTIIFVISCKTNIVSYVDCFYVILFYLICLPLCYTFCIIWCTYYLVFSSCWPMYDQCDFLVPPFFHFVICPYRLSALFYINFVIINFLIAIL